MSLWDKSAGAVPIVPSQLVVGLFVWLDLKWSEHPFLSNRMLIKTADDVAIMQSLQLAGRLYCFPDKSEVPLPSQLSESAQGKPLVRAAAPPVVSKQLQEQKKPPSVPRVAFFRGSSNDYLHHLTGRSVFATKSGGGRR